MGANRNCEHAKVDRQSKRNIVSGPANIECLPILSLTEGRAQNILNSTFMEFLFLKSVFINRNPSHRLWRREPSSGL